VEQNALRLETQNNAGVNMTIDFHQLVLLALLGTAIHWIVARSQIMKWFWDLRWWPRVRIVQNKVTVDEGLLATPLYNFTAGLLACTACAGWWLGLSAGLLRIRPLELGSAWLDILGSGLAGVVVVPILEGVLIWGLEASHID
jgi:hypothetical protein